MSQWIQQNTRANRFNDSYIKGFVDISGGNLLLRHGDASMNQKLYVDGATTLNSTLTVNGDATLSGNNTFAGTNTFTNYLPECSITPTSNNQFVNKSYVDSVSGGGGDVTLSGNNTFTGTENIFNNIIKVAHPASGTTKLSYFGDAVVGSKSTYNAYAYFGHYSQINTGTYGNYALMQNSTGSTFVNAAENQAIYFSINNSSKVTILSNGTVGIGTSTPRAHVHIEGTRYDGGFDMSQRNYFKFNTGVTNIQNVTNTVNMAAGLYVRYDIVTNDHVISANITNYSDRRIKENIIDIDDGSALETLRLIKPKKYDYKDKVLKTNSTVWGFIAQEVKEVLPYSTNLMKKEIPNIFQLAVVSNNNQLIFENDIEFEYDTSGSLVKKLVLYDVSDNRIDTTIVDVSNNIVTLSEDIVTTDASGNITTILDASNNIFVYGQEVDDFHGLDKSSIFTITTAALQEVDRQLQSEKAKTASLETKVSLLETQLADIISRVTALEPPST